MSLEWRVALAPAVRRCRGQVVLGGRLEARQLEFRPQLCLSLYVTF